MDSSVLYKLAYELHYTDQNFSEAVKVYQKIINDYPNSAEAEYAKTQIQSIQKMVDKKPQAINLGLERPHNKQVSIPGYANNQSGFVQNPQMQYEATHQRLKMNSQQPTNFHNSSQYQPTLEQQKMPAPEEYNWQQNENKKPDFLNNRPANEPRYGNETQLPREYASETPVNFVNKIENIAQETPSLNGNGNKPSQASFKTIQNFKTFFEDKNETVVDASKNQKATQPTPVNQMAIPPESNPQPENLASANNKVAQISNYAWNQPKMETMQGSSISPNVPKDPKTAAAEAAAGLANNFQQSKPKEWNKVKQVNEEAGYNKSMQAAPPKDEVATAPISSSAQSVSKTSDSDQIDIMNMQNKIDVLLHNLKTHQNGLTVVFSTVIPGLGQIYAGMIKQGAIWIISWVLGLIMLYSLSYKETPTGVVFKGLGLRQMLIMVVMLIIWFFNLKQINKNIRR